MKIIKKTVKTPCYCCSRIGGKPTPRNRCKVCKGTGKYNETTYYHIITTKSGKQICFSADTLK